MKNRFLLILSTILLMLILVVKGETEVGKVCGKNPNAIVTFDSKVDNSYTIIAETTGDWIFTDDFSWSGPNGWYSDSKYIISCERFDFAHKPTAFVDASLIFGASMNGKMYVPGGEGGSPIPWTVSAAYHLAPTPCLTPILSIIAKGNTCQLLYGYDVSGINPGGYWKYTGTTVTNETISEGWGNNIGSLYTTPSTLEAGQYTFTAARNTQGAFSANANVTVVKVEAMEATSDSADGYSMEDYIDIIYIPRNELITLSAIPAPGNQWPQNEPLWDDGTVDDCSVFQEESPGYYTVDVSCGTSSVEMDIDVVGVASITGTSGTISVPSTIDDITKLTVSQTMYLYKGQGKIEFQALKAPVGSEWPDRYPKWKDGSTEVGTGETYTFNSPSTTGEHIITAHCGDGYYRAIKVIVFELQATDMAFNYDRTSSSSDGMNLRGSYSGAEILAPEATASGGGKKVLYKKDMSVTIKTRFELIPAGATPSLKVKAVAGGSMEGLGEKSITIKNTGISDGDTIATKAGFVAFNSTKNTADKIKKETYSFQWKLTEINGEILSAPINLNSISGVTVYTILDTSKSPWAANGNGKTQPWVSALEFATITCSAADKTTQDATLNAITDHLYTIAYQGDSTCRKSSATGYYFCYTTYMGTNRANCLDSAVGLSITAKILGIDLRSRRRTDFFGFNFHCFTVDSSSAYVYDSCSAMSSAIKKMSYSTYISAGNPTSSSAEYAEEYPIR